MDTTAWTLFLVAGMLAVADWIAVVRRSKPLEYAAKPAVLAALTGAALVVDPAHAGQRAWFVVALVCCLLGDVFLMLPSDRFVAGLASFLVGHLAYVVGFAVAGVPIGRAAAGAIVIIPTTLIVGRRIAAALRARRETALLGPVVAYMLAISAMAILAFREPLAAAGASLFYGSDALIAWNRFVHPVEWAPLAIIVTYHFGQAALVGSLV